MATILIVDDDRRTALALRPVIALADVPRAQRTADPQGTALRFSLAKPIADEALVRTLAWALRCGTFQRPLQDLQHALVQNRAQATLLEARVKELVQQVQVLRERLDGRDLAPEEPPS